MADPALKIETDEDWSMSDRRERAVMRVPEAMTDPAIDTPFPAARGKLTKAEIEALLRPDLPDELEEDTGALAPEDRRFDQFDGEPQNEHERDDADARAIAAAVSLGLRQDCQLPAVAHVVQIGSGEFGDVFIGNQQGSACLFFQDEAGQLVAALTLSADLATCLIDHACGGEGVPGGITGRALTVLDADILSSILSPIGPSLGTGYTLARTETDTRYASAMAPPGAAELIDLTVTLGGIEAPARLAILHAASLQQSQPAVAFPDVSLATAIITARIATLSVPVSKLSDLKPGATLMLGIPADQPVELLSGGRDGIVAAEGEIGRKGNAIAVRVNRRGTYLRQARRKAQQTY